MIRVSAKSIRTTRTPISATTPSCRTDYYEDILSQIWSRWTEISAEDVSRLELLSDAGRLLGLMAAQVILESSNSTGKERRTAFSCLSRAMRDAYMTACVGTGS